MITHLLKEIAQLKWGGSRGQEAMLNKIFRSPSWTWLIFCALARWILLIVGGIGELWYLLYKLLP